MLNQQEYIGPLADHACTVFPPTKKNEEIILQDNYHLNQIKYRNRIVQTFFFDPIRPYFA